MERPRLRKVHRIRERTADGEHIVLYDPLGLSDDVRVDAAAEPILDRFDGTRTLAQVRQSLLLAGQPAPPLEDLAAFARDLSQAGCLDDAAFADRSARLVAAFDAAPVRPAVAPGRLLPAEPEATARLLSRVLPPTVPRTRADSTACALVTPPGAPDAAGALLDATCRDLPRAEDLDRVVILGTDPMPGHEPFSLCPKDYGTALGSVPLDRDAAARLERARPVLTREALRHRRADTVELAATYLAWLYAPKPPPIVPVLVSRAALERSDATDALLGTLDAVLSRGRTLYWASAALSHVGPAFGNALPAGRARREDLRTVEALAHGRSSALRKRTVPSSGAAVLATLLELLPDAASLAWSRYDQGPPGEATRGVVGRLGARFARPPFAPTGQV